MKNTANNSLIPILYPRNLTHDQYAEVNDLYSENDDIVYISRDGDGLSLRQGKVLKRMYTHILIEQQEQYSVSEYRIHVSEIIARNGIPVFSMTYNELNDRYRFHFGTIDGKVCVEIVDTKHVSRKPIHYFMS
jgi:hypothetical protein